MSGARARRAERLVGVAVIAVALLGAVLITVAVSIGYSDSSSDEPDQGLVLGIWEIFYDTSAPPAHVLLAAAGLGLLLAAGVAVVERRIATRARRSLDAGDQPLAPRVVMGETRGTYAGPVTITVLIPAHDEEAAIGRTLTSLLSQSHRPERVVVVADNCTDRTVEIARLAGVEVFETAGNQHKKAGALNQALTGVLPALGDNDTVMVMDADTALDPGFLEHAVRLMTDDRALMAVGGLFYGEDGGGLIGQFQRNEYTRYARELERRRGRVFVLTGTASIFRARALRTVQARRGVSLPGVPGDVYDTVALTEDNELTLAIKSLGGLTVSPRQCTVVTEVMPTWGALWKQRLRWQRGALENLGAYGFRPTVMRYWAQQLAIGYGAVAFATYVLALVLLLLAMDRWVWFPFWIGIGVVFTVERVVTVWRGGWRARLLAAMLFPELFYALFLNAVFVKGVLDLALGRQATWSHVAPAPSPQTDRT